MTHHTPEEKSDAAARAQGSFEVGILALQAAAKLVETIIPPDDVKSRISALAVMATRELGALRAYADSLIASGGDQAEAGKGMHEMLDGLLEQAITEATRVAQASEEKRKNRVEELIEAALAAAHAEEEPGD